MKKLIKKVLNKLSQNKEQSNEPSINQKVHVNIGENVRFMGENVLDKVNPHLVHIGNHCVIGHRSSILAHCPIRGALAAKVGNFVWVGFGVIVLPGAKIGNNSIVGGGSVVVKEHPDNVVLAGNPARVIRKLSTDEVSNLQYRLTNRLPMVKKSKHDRF